MYEVKYEKLQEGLSNLSSYQKQLINEYCENDMKKLKRISYLAFCRYNIPNYEHDELYDDALGVLMESVVDFDVSKQVKFETYLTNNIKKSVIDWYRDNYQRGKRKNLLTDKTGKIIRTDKFGNITEDGKGTPIVIPSISFDVDTEEDNSLKDKIASDFNVEAESKIDFGEDENVNIFLAALSDVQRKILLLRMDDVSTDEIKKILKLSDREYTNETKSIKMNKNLSLFTRNKNDGNYKMEGENNMDRIIEIGEAESYRMDKMSMYALIQDKKNGDMNCNYILQREPFQWTTEEANRYFCRILSNLPIPEIILCEQQKKGLTISHLIDGLQRLSYAEAYKENRIKIGSVGAERHLIQYREFLLDDNGKRILDEDGLPKYEIKVFDVIGKYYKDLPDELKRRFNNFNVNVTKFFNCSDEQIADHIRDYNNHASMNKEQGGLLNVSANTAKKIKNISQKSTFFKNCGKFSDNSKIKGKLERVVTEAIMLLFFRDSWKPNLDLMYKYVDQNATEQQFLKVNSQLNRLELALGDNNKDLTKALFSPTTMPMWIAVFDKFTTYNLDDSLFVDFLNAYNNELKNKEIDGVSMKDFKDQQTKKRTTITGKINLLIKLMNDFLHIKNETDNEVENNSIDIDNDIDPLQFVKRNITDQVSESDIDLYYEMMDDFRKNKAINEHSAVFNYQNELSFLAMIAYSFKVDRDLDKWLVDYTHRNIICSSNQVENLENMINDFKIFDKQAEEIKMQSA